ncbi:AEC family transporter [Thermocrinis sp.]
MLEIIIPVISASLLKRLGVFKEGHERILIDYVLFFSLPILSFKAGYDIQTSADILKVSSVAWASILACMLLAFAITKLLNLSNKETKTFLLISSFGNTAFLGYPYAYTYFGQEGLQVAIIYDNIGSFLLVSSLGVIIASGKLNLKEVILFPPFLGLILGFSMKGFNIPIALVKALDFVALSTLPIILFALGLSISVRGIKKNFKLALLAVFIKILMAFFTSLTVGKLISLHSVAMKVSILESVMPPMMFSAVLAIRYNLSPDLAFSAVGLGMLLSFVYVPLFVSLLERFL